ncbi:hypothetical protein C8R41DRAFT_863440 [Lentinula lateritia]|uniref:Uncharacterized protein n=1 Tax=Lentinula lateritia TaxID=40482 RepID=A0ABQ8VUQ3_9AGAR|nr:hypothetical protein C8R41DRAFT_863440 [Lentinula lateritia]
MNQLYPLWPQVQDPPAPPTGAQNAALYLPHRFMNILGMNPPALHFTHFPFSVALNLAPNVPPQALQVPQAGAFPVNLPYNGLLITQRFPLPVTLSNNAVNVNHTQLFSKKFNETAEFLPCTAVQWPAITCTTRQFPGCLPVIPLPSQEQQINAIHGLWAWHQERCTRPTFIEVESEPAVQDEVKKQLLNPLDLLLHKNGTWFNYPRWGRLTIGSNLGQGEHGKHTAGFSDHALYVGGYRQCLAALCEVKTFWAYKSEQMHALSGPSNGTKDVNHKDKVFAQIPGETNVLDWNLRGTATKALKQIWGQMVYNDTHYATWTNGEHILVFLHTGVDELTVTTHNYNGPGGRRSHRWDDPDVLAALFGMCCAAIDSKFLGDQNLMQHFIGPVY